MKNTLVSVVTLIFFWFAPSAYAQKIKDAELNRNYDVMTDSTIFFGHYDSRGTSHIFNFNGVSSGNVDRVSIVYLSMMYRVNIRSTAQAVGQNLPLEVPDFLMIVDDSIRIRLTGKIVKSGRSTGILGMSTDEMRSNYYLTTEQVRALVNANLVRARLGDVEFRNFPSEKSKKSLSSLCDRLSECRN